MSDWIAFDNCQRCHGDGYETIFTELFDDIQIEKVQCRICEKLDNKYMEADYRRQQAKDDKYE